MANINDLPVEVLLRIFKFYVISENQYKLLHILSNVCELWESVCQDSSLWIKFDGTVKYETMNKLSIVGCLNKTKELKVSHVRNFKYREAQKFFGHLNNLEVLNLSQVEYFCAKIMRILSKSRFKLREIQVGCKKRGMKAPFVGYHHLIPFLSSKGIYLTTIKLSDTVVHISIEILKSLAENCPNLEHFECTYHDMRCGIFPTESFELNCPKLRFLKLYNFHIGRENPSVGFPKLEVFMYNEHFQEHRRLRDRDIERVLFNSPNLKRLNLLAIAFLTDILYSLPANSVQSLSLSRCEMFYYQNDLPEILSKWNHSLKEVDISYCDIRLINGTILTLTTLPMEPPIEFLDLRHTEVTSDTVKTILEECKHLKRLHLMGCKKLGELRKNYNNKAELKTLLEKLQHCKDSMDKKICE